MTSKNDAKKDLATRQKEFTSKFILSYLNIHGRLYNMNIVTDIYSIILQYYWIDQSPLHWAYSTPGADIKLFHHPTIVNYPFINNIACWSGKHDKYFRGNAMCNYWIKHNTGKHTYIIKTYSKNNTKIFSVVIGIATPKFNIKEQNYLEFVTNSKVFEFGCDAYAKVHGHARCWIDDDSRRYYTSQYRSTKPIQFFEDNDKLPVTMKMVIDSNNQNVDLYLNDEPFIDKNEYRNVKEMTNIFENCLNQQDKRVTLVGWVWQNYDNSTTFGKTNECGLMICDYYCDK